MTEIELQGISKAYRASGGMVRAVDDVSLRIARISRQKSYLTPSEDKTLRLEALAAEVEEQAHLEAGCLEVGQYLCYVVAVQARQRFEFHFYGRFDHQVGAELSAQGTSVRDLIRLLTLEGNPRPYQFQTHSPVVDSLWETGT